MRRLAMRDSRDDNSWIQRPGAGRPAGGESSRHAVGGHGAQRRHCDQPAAGVGGGARGPAEWRQRDRCGGHGGRGSLGCGTDDERDRRGPVCAGLRSEDEDGAGAQREWTRAGGGDDRGVQAPQPRRHALPRRAVGQRAGRRGRLERAARQARHDRPRQGAAAGDPLREGRLCGQRDHLLPVEGPGGDAGARSRRCRDVPHRRSRPARR